MELLSAGLVIFPVLLLAAIGLAWKRRSAFTRETIDRIFPELQVVEARRSPEQRKSEQRKHFFQRLQLRWQ